MKIVLTGKMEMNRVHMTNKFLEMGIQVLKNVVISTDYLITGEAPGNNKIQAAKRRGITIMTENEFWNFLENEYPEYFL